VIGRRLPIIIIIIIIRESLIDMMMVEHVFYGIPPYETHLGWGAKVVTAYFHQLVDLGQ